MIWVSLGNIALSYNVVGYPLSTHNITSTRREKLAKQG